MNRESDSHAVKESPLRFGIAYWKFQNGKVYELRPRCRLSPALEKDGRARSLRFLRDQGPHHIFSSVKADWLESFTDLQLMDYAIEEEVD